MWRACGDIEIHATHVPAPLAMRETQSAVFSSRRAESRCVCVGLLCVFVACVRARITYMMYDCGGVGVHTGLLGRAITGFDHALCTTKSRILLRI